MEDVKHTPGPWVPLKGTEEEADRWVVCQDIRREKFLIATVENGAPGDTLETEARNARLIAAAPTLLAYAECEAAWAGWQCSTTTFKELVATFTRHGYAGELSRGLLLPVANKFLAELRNRAIAKATGQEGE